MESNTSPHNCYPVTQAIKQNTAQSHKIEKLGPFQRAYPCKKNESLRCLPAVPKPCYRTHAPASGRAPTTSSAAPPRPAPPWPSPVPTTLGFSTCAAPEQRGEEGVAALPPRSPEALLPHPRAGLRPRAPTPPSTCPPWTSSAARTLLVPASNPPAVERAQKMTR